MASYVFNLERIERLGSGGESAGDGFAACTLRGDGRTGDGCARHLELGDGSAGGRALDLEMGPISADDPATLVAFSFEIGRGNGGRSLISNGAFENLPASFGRREPTDDAGGSTNWGTFVMGSLVGAVLARPDGPLALDRVVVTTQTLAEWTASGRCHRETRDYLARGNGRTPIRHRVTWSVRRSEG
jgi:hypothetical protein